MAKTIEVEFFLKIAKQGPVKEPKQWKVHFRDGYSGLVVPCDEWKRTRYKIPINTCYDSVNTQVFLVGQLIFWRFLVK